MQKELLIFVVLIAVIVALFNFTAAPTEVTAAGDLNNSDKVYISDSLPGVKIFTERHPGQKCERCWHYFETTSNTQGNITCQRCQDHLQAVEE